MTYPHYGPPQPYGYGFVPQPPDHPQATTVLILGIVSIVLSLSCGIGAIVGPFAWVMGRRALTEIDNSGGAIGGRSTTNVGYILGIVATIVGILYVLLIVGIFVLPFLLFGLAAA